MAKKFADYARERDARLSDEGKLAVEVFSAAAEVGSALHQARRAAGLNQTELGALSGVSQGDISRIERGLLSPTATTLLRLVHAMGGELRIAIPKRG